jgi:translin
MNRPTENLDAIADQIRQSFSARDAAREKVLTLCREVIRYSSTTIRAAHRQEFDPARGLLSSAASQLKSAEQEVAAYPEFRYTGFFRDAQKEFSEASITLALVTEEPIPAPDALGVEYAAYLNGLGEAVGELRRYLLDGIRRDDLSRVESLLSAMDTSTMSWSPWTSPMRLPAACAAPRTWCAASWKGHVATSPWSSGRINWSKN